MGIVKLIYSMLETKCKKLGLKIFKHFLQLFAFNPIKQLAVHIFLLFLDFPLHLVGFPTYNLISV